jgi:hypothetical protein
MCENILQFLPISSDEQSRLLLRIRKEQPRALPVAANVDGTIGAAQAGDGQPEGPGAASVAGRLRFGNQAREGGFGR